MNPGSAVCGKFVDAC